MQIKSIKKIRIWAGKLHLTSIRIKVKSITKEKKQLNILNMSILMKIATMGTIIITNINRVNKVYINMKNLIMDITIFINIGILNQEGKQIIIANAKKLQNSYKKRVVTLKIVA